MLTKVGSKYNPPRTFAIVERNKVPSPLLLARRPELKQERQLLERLSYRHWKAISMRVGIGLGDTYGPMHYPGMRSLWQSPANFHQHLAFPPPFPSPGPPTWFLFLLLPLQTLLACYCPRMVTINRKGGWGKAVLSSEYGTKLKVCNHPVLFPIMMELIADTSRGENVFDSALLVQLQTEQWKHPKTKNHRLQVCLMLWKYEPVV